MSLDVGQWAALGRDLAAAPARIHTTAAPVVHASLEAVETAAKANAPVLTGQLRESIHADEDGDGLGGSVSTDVRYAVFVEYGTSKMAAEPFMGPAADAGTGQLIEGLAAAGEAATL